MVNERYRQTNIGLQTQIDGQTYLDRQDGRRERETDRQTDRQTETDSEIDKQKYRQRQSEDKQ